MTRARSYAALLAMSALGGCRACKNDHPYVPYSIDGEAPPTAIDAGSATATPLDASRFADANAAVAPPNATAWTLDGLALVAPEGKVFTVGLTGDFNGDGHTDAIAVVRNAQPPDLGEVWVYLGSASGMNAGVRSEGPPPATLDPSCSPTERLVRIGAHSVLTELGTVCGERAASTPWRWIGIVDAEGVPRLRASALVVDPDGAPTLTVDAETYDFDKDGHDDLLLRVTLEGGGAPFEPGPKVSAAVKWFDRSAGMSREPDEPEASLHALAVTAMARAAKPKDAASVPLLAHQARALYAALCAEGGAPRLARVMGDHPIQCGSSCALEELTLAETRAYVTLGDPLRATAALDSSGVFPATRLPARAAEAVGWIEKIAPPFPATTLRTVLAVPLSEHGRTPTWAALAFESSGKLLVRTPAGVARVDPVSGDESEATGVAAWRSEVLSPDGASRLVSVLDPCDGFALRATLASPADGHERGVLLPIAPRVGTKCDVARGAFVRVLPVAWGPLGLEVVAAGFPILIAPDLTHAVPLTEALAQPVTPGAPRSPDGRTRVVPTTEGILVLGSHARLLRAKELDGAYGELYDCVVSDDAARVACVRGGGAFVGIWDGGG